MLFNVGFSPYGKAKYDLKETTYGYSCGTTGGPPNCVGNSGKYLKLIRSYSHSSEAKTAEICCGTCGLDYGECDCWEYDESTSTPTCSLYENTDPSK